MCENLRLVRDFGAAIREPMHGHPAFGGTACPYGLNRSDTPSDRKDMSGKMPDL